MTCILVKLVLNLFQDLERARLCALYNSLQYSKYKRYFNISKYCSGDLCEVELPVPIPNTEVKRLSGDDSCRATDRENISSPEQCFEIRTCLQIMSVENQLPEIQISLKPDQLAEIQKARAEFLELVLSIPTPAHDNCSGGILEAKRINLIENLQREGPELRVFFRASSFCAKFKTCGSMIKVTFNLGANKWEGPNANRSIVSSAPKVTDDESDLFKRLGGFGKLTADSQRPDNEGLPGSKNPD